MERYKCEKVKWLAVLLCILVLAIHLQSVAAAADVVIKTQQAADNVSNGIRGIDVSHYQGDINWTQVAGDNVHFAIARASYGLEADRKFVANVEGASKNGLLVGAYHYAKFYDEKSMREEAAFFLKQLEGKDFTYPIFLDIEDNAQNRSVSKNDLTDFSIQFMELVKERGYTVMFYTGTNFLKDRLDAARLSDYGLWVANYVEEPDQGQKLWQHTSYGKIDGISERALIDIAYADLSVKRRLSVNREQSDAIKRTLNERYGAGLEMGVVNMSEVKRVVVAALQSELNRQLNAGLEVTGIMDAPTLYSLEAVPFTYEETKGNITYLIQVMLFYRGYYTEDLTGVYDSRTASALTRYQAVIEQPSTGAMNRETLWYLFQ